MKLAISIAFILLSGLAHAQKTFVPGYIIDNQNMRTECLILNRDWKNNPGAFSYKLTDGGPELTGDTTSVAEFGIIGGNAYVRAEVNIDRSSNEVSNLSKLRNPEWSKETLFLKVLFRGNASLYYYEVGTMARMFYKVGEKPIEQLIYKKYREVKDGHPVDYFLENHTFRQQLWRDVRCESTEMVVLERLDYFPKKLIQYFTDYASCTEDQTSQKAKVVKTKSFNLDVGAGLIYNDFSASNDRSGEKFEFQENTSIRIGMGMEFLLPFYNDRVGVILELAHQRFSSKEKVQPLTTVEFESIDLSVGSRYRFYKKENVQCFATGLFTQSFTKNDAIFRHRRDPLDFEGSASFMIGGGMTFKRLSIELRFINAFLLHDYPTWVEDFYRYGAFVRYRIL